MGTGDVAFASSTLPQPFFFSSFMMSWRPAGLFGLDTGLLQGDTGEVGVAGGATLDAASLLDSDNNLFLCFWDIFVILLFVSLTKINKFVSIKYASEKKSWNKNCR